MGQARRSPLSSPPPLTQGTRDNARGARQQGRRRLRLWHHDVGARHGRRPVCRHAARVAGAYDYERTQEARLHTRDAGGVP